MSAFLYQGTIYLLAAVIAVPIAALRVRPGDSVQGGAALFEIAD